MAEPKSAEAAVAGRRAVFMATLDKLDKAALAPVPAGVDQAPVPSIY